VIAAGATRHGGRSVCNRVGCLGGRVLVKPVRITLKISGGEDFLQLLNRPSALRPLDLDVRCRKLEQCTNKSGRSVKSHPHASLSAPEKIGLAATVGKADARRGHEVSIGVLPG